MIITFDDFRKFAIDNNKRIYYYQMDNVIELAFITEGIFVKSYVDITKIPNKDVFFTDKLFFGATKLLFRLPGDETKIDMFNITPIEIDFEDTIDEYKTEEIRQDEEDIQKEGVNPDSRINT